MHTTTVTLRLIFYGLLAFTPDDFRYGQQTRALLIDARNSPVASDGCPIHPHTPVLMFESPRCEPPCRLEAGLCRCELDRDLLHVGLPPAQSCARITSCGVDRICNAQPAQSPSTGAGPGRVPKLGWLKIWNGSLRLRSGCDVAYPSLDPPPNSDPICDLVAAQVNFEQPERLKTCALSGEEERTIRAVAAGQVEVEAPRFKFKPLTSKNFLDVFGLLRWGLNRRHLAEIVMAETVLQIGCASSVDPDCGKQVELEVVAFDCSESYTFTIETYPRGGTERYADLIVANHPDTRAHDFGYPRCRDHYVARDFELYHDLVRGPMYTSDRPVPQPWRHGRLEKVDRDDCASETLKILREELLRTGEVVPICPGTGTAR